MMGSCSSGRVQTTGWTDLKKTTENSKAATQCHINSSTYGIPKWDQLIQIIRKGFLEEVQCFKTEYYQLFQN